MRIANAGDAMGTPTQPMGKMLAAKPKAALKGGYFYFFLRNSGPMFSIPGLGDAALGHVGWAFQFNDSGSHYIGSMENLSGSPVTRGKARVDAGYWFGARTGGRESVLREMATCQMAEEQLGFAARQRSSGRPNDLTNHIQPYDQWKVCYVEKPDPNKALRRAQQWGNGGVAGITYSALMQNCLDNAVTIAQDYGVRNLPWRWNHPAPWVWFNAVEAEDGGDVPL